MLARALLLLATLPASAAAQQGEIAACRAETDSLKRLTCYDSIPVETAPVSDAEAFMRKVDAAVAFALRDPGSASQYAVGEPVDCKALEVAAYVRGDCVCFQVNAANAYGGMVGARIGVVSVKKNGIAEAFLDRVVTDHNRRICRNNGFAPRDSKLIHAAAK